jgi:CBS domain-containing protein
MSDALPFVPSNSSVDAAWEVARTLEPPAVLVGGPTHLLGVVTREQLAAARGANRGLEAVSAVLQEKTVHVHPDHPLDVVVERFAESGGLLPVVNRGDVRQVEGTIALRDITSFAVKRSSSRGE